MLMSDVPIILATDILTNPDKKGLIGRGSFGTVRLCKTSELKEVAVKCYRLTGVGMELEATKCRLQNEAKNLHMLEHEHIVKVHGICVWKNSFGIVLEYIPGGNLDSLLKKKHIDIPWCMRTRISLQLNEAILFLHTSKPPRVYIHGDIKPENILLTLTLTVKLADFDSLNVARCTGATTTTIDQQITKQHTPFYTAPELLKNLCGPRTADMDTYGFGMVLYEVVTRNRVYEEASLPPRTVVQTICDTGQRPNLVPLQEIQSQLKEEDLLLYNVLVSYMKECWSPNPEERPHLQQVGIHLREAFGNVRISTINEKSQQLIENLNIKPEIVDEDDAITLNDFNYPFEQSESSITKESERSLPNIDEILPENDVPCDIVVPSSEDTEPLIANEEQGRGKSSKWKKLMCISLVMVMLVLSSTLAICFHLSAHKAEESACRKLKRPANGGSLTCNKESCLFHCPVGYLMMESKSQLASNVTSCLSKNKTWSNPVPYCEKVSFCEPIQIVGLNDNSFCLWKNIKTFISTKTSQVGYRNGSLCTLACLAEYNIHGAQEASCKGTSWVPALPTCKIKECPPLTLPAFVEKSCTRSCDVFSTCSFSCSEGQLKGNLSITCESSSKWSGSPPTCSGNCPKCLTGPECKDLTSWKKLLTYIDDIKPWSTITAIYAGFSISCHVNKHGGIFSFKWDCTCIDVMSSTQARCNNYASSRGSCEHTLSALVNKMVSAKVYPEPCDASSMPTECQ